MQKPDEKNNQKKNANDKKKPQKIEQKAPDKKTANVTQNKKNHGPVVERSSAKKKQVLKKNIINQIQIKLKKKCHFQSQNRLRLSKKFQKIK